jgi:hypothetical protein
MHDLNVSGEDSLCFRPRVQPLSAVTHLFIALMYICCTEHTSRCKESRVGPTACMSKYFENILYEFIINIFLLIFCGISKDYVQDI